MIPLQAFVLLLSLWSAASFSTAPGCLEMWAECEADSDCCGSEPSNENHATFKGCKMGSGQPAAEGHPGMCCDESDWMRCS